MVHSGFDFEVFGKVQGVFFRYSPPSKHHQLTNLMLMVGPTIRKHTEEKAKELGLVGWVMNTPEGTVVGQAQGDPSALQTLRKWLQEVGSPKSRIDRCEFKNERDDLSALEFSSFGVKRPSRKKREESGGSEKRKSREVASPSKDAGDRKKKKKKEKTKKAEDEESNKVKKQKNKEKKTIKESA